MESGVHLTRKDLAKMLHPFVFDFSLVALLNGAPSFLGEFTSEPINGQSMSRRKKKMTVAGLRIRKTINGLGHGAPLQHICSIRAKLSIYYDRVLYVRGSGVRKKIRGKLFGVRGAS